MRTFLVLAVLGVSVPAAADLQSVTVCADRVIDVGGVAGKSEVELALTGASVRAGMSRCKDGGDLAAFVVFQGGKVAIVDVGGAKDRTLEKCVATALRTATLSTKTRVVATVGIHVPMPAINTGNVPTADNVVGGEETDEGLDRGEIRRVIDLNKGPIRACYEAQVSKEPNLAGKIVAKIEVSPTGAVASATITSSTFKTDAVPTCVTAAIKRFKFPPRISKTVLSYPFVFSSVE